MGKITFSLLSSLLLICSVSSGAEELELRALVPEHVGLTQQKSPMLCYYISHTTSLPIRFTLIANHKSAPVAEVTLKPPSSPGIQEIRLEDYNIVLEEDVQYRWYVSVIQNADSPSKDIVAGGVIERVDPRLVDYYGRPCKRSTVQGLREDGVWYDAFACVNQLIERNPEDRSLRDLRNELLGIPKSIPNHDLPLKPMGVLTTNRPTQGAA